METRPPVKRWFTFETAGFAWSWVIMFATATRVEYQAHMAQHALFDVLAHRMSGSQQIER